MSGNSALLAAACVLVVAVAQTQAAYEGSPVEGRIKRQAAPAGIPPMWKELRECCKIPSVILPSSRSRCFPAPGSSTSVPPVAGAPKNCNHTCAVECAYKIQGLVNSATGTVDTTQLSARITALVAADPKWTAALNAATATCITPGLPAVSPTSVCKSGSFEVMSCINNQLYQKCPDSVKNASAKCAELLARATARSG